MAKLDFSNSPSASVGARRLQNTAESTPKQSVVEIPVSKLLESPLNEGMPMGDIETLAESIRVHGQQEAMHVYRRGSEYEIFAGHRRFHAMRDILGMQACKCIVHKYPEDERTRFADHFINNAERRENSFGFWSAEIEAAKDLLQHEGFEGNKTQLTEAVCSLLENKISPAQVHRLEGIAGMEPEMKALCEAGYAPSVVYAAVKLSPDQQRSLANKVKQEMEKTGDLISRETFAQLINAMRSTDIDQGRAEPEKPKRERGYFVRLQTLESRFRTAVGKPKSEKDREAAIQSIQSFRKTLDELEASLRGS